MGPTPDRRDFLGLLLGGAAGLVLPSTALGQRPGASTTALAATPLSDNLIRPWLISRGVEMPMTLVILGVFGGFVSFGFLGLFVGPALLAIAFTLVRAWRGPAAVPPR